MLNFITLIQFKKRSFSKTFRIEGLENLNYLVGIVFKQKILV